MMYWYDDPGGWGYAMMVLSMVVFWGLMVGAVILLVLRVSGSRPMAPVIPQDPMIVLRERLARGEIDETEYRQRMQVLNGD
jgi:putative membrane protein